MARMDPPLNWEGSDLCARHGCGCDRRRERMDVSSRSGGIFLEIDNSAMS